MRPEILLLDGCADSAEMYSVGLGFAGYRTRIVKDTSEALRQLRQKAPAAVVADLDEVAADRSSFLRELSAQPSWHSIPVVLLTGWVTLPHALEDLPRALILLKPCLPDTLATVLREVAPEVDRGRGKAGLSFDLPTA